MLTKYPTLPIHHHHLLHLQCRCSSDFNPLLFSLIIIIFKIISLYGPANTKPAILLTLYRCRCFISSLLLFFSFAIADKIIKKIIYPDQYGSDAFSMSSCYRSKSHISQKVPKRGNESFRAL